jgi:hypothetical protein
LFRASIWIFALAALFLCGCGSDMHPAEFTIAWSAPAAIPYGTALGSTQLNANANIAGTFSCSPPAGTVLSAGTHTLTVTFTPTVTANHKAITVTAPLTVNKAGPVISWPAPSSVVNGIALNATQLYATANTPGTFTYAPAAGTVLSTGTSTLSVTFTPTNTANYATATATQSLTVNVAAALSITWSPPRGDHLWDGAGQNIVGCYCERSWHLHLFSGCTHGPFARNAYAECNLYSNGHCEL